MNNIIDTQNTSTEETSSVQCPDCKVGQIMTKAGKFGEFQACNRFPECQYRVQKEPEAVGRICEECGDELVYRISRKSTIRFIGCNNFPDCHYVERIEKAE